MSEDMARVAEDALTNTHEDFAKMLRDLLEESDDLDEQLHKSVRPTLTREEMREQVISFIMGMMPRRSTMTRQEVVELLDSQY